MQEIQPCIIFDPHNLHLCKYTTHLFVVKSNLFRATARTYENPFISTLDLDKPFPLLNEAFHKALEADTHFLGLVHGDKLHVDWFYDEGEFFPAMDMPLEGNPLQLPTASIGIAVYPEEANDINNLFLLADQRLYKAKSRGRNQIEPVINPWKTELSG